MISDQVTRFVILWINLPTHYSMGIRSLYLLLCLGCCLNAGAQSATRPSLQVGDTIFLSRDMLPHPIDLSRSGTNLYWDLSRLMSPFVHQSLLRPDGNGGFIITGADDVERYLTELQDGVYLTRLILPHATASQRTTVRIDPPLPYVKQTRPGEAWDYRGTLTLSGSHYPRELRLAITIHAEADAEGELYSPTSRYDVVRERRDIEVTVSSGGPSVSIHELGLPPGFTSGRCYVFQSASRPVPVAVILTDAMNQAKQVEYLSHPWAGNLIQQIPRRPEIFVYPNPSFGNVRFDFLNLSAGNYELEIYNILGTKIRTERVSISGNKTLPLDLTGLKKGTYIYRLVDSQKNTIRSKRLVIISA